MLTKFTQFIRLLEGFTRSILVFAGVGSVVGTTLICIFAICVGLAPTVRFLT